ncbi:MAG: hypothetical protein QOF71_821 [Candidatus Eremiobacteraeota bacterium]|jgi:hypothetical protein|nr:hypothetical protein [Candidatus Eremiobacteraeota bacterium]
MLEANNPDLDVDALMARVQHEVLRRQFGDGSSSGAGLETIDTSTLQSLIAAAALRSSARNRWPARLEFFPFNVRAVQRLVLRAIAWLFRDQHAFNAALIDALSESVTVSARIHASMREIDGRLRRLEERA